MTNQLLDILEYIPHMEITYYLEKHSGVCKQTSLVVTKFYEQIPQYMITNDRSNFKGI